MMFGNSKRENDLSDALHKSNEEIKRLVSKLRYKEAFIENVCEANSEQLAALHSANRRIHILSLELNETLTANSDFLMRNAKNEDEIDELKADIAEQVRINRVYAQEIGSQREEINRLMVIDTSRYFKSDSYLAFSGEKPEPIKLDVEPEPSHIFEEQLAKRDKTIKRLKARVKKLRSDNKAMAAEILHNRNSM